MCNALLFKHMKRDRFQSGSWPGGHVITSMTSIRREMIGFHIDHDLAFDINQRSSPIVFDGNPSISSLVIEKFWIAVFFSATKGQGYSLFKQVGQGCFSPTEAPDKGLLAFELLYTQLDLERNGEIWYQAGGFAKPFPYIIPTYCMLHHVKCFVRYLLQIQSQSDCLMLSRKVLQKHCKNKPG